ncbi:oxygen-insensitive NADPH nitroreductase [Granulosicoccaceae sp. 1_MG-2023]|nr:oxygen-insensitive NADPH nitroreductase [Granulosicoccaceae sp. 1_MG-2023]
MNATIDLLKSHRSIRKYTDQPVGDEALETIISAGQAAATSSFVQATTVIRVTDPEHRKQLRHMAGDQPYIEKAPEFLVFCADLARASLCCEMHGIEAQADYTEQFIIATVDTGLFAQNCAVAAESMGLGICYIGGIRNNIADVAELLGLPEHVYPVFGFCIGHPDQDPDLRPRLPMSVVLKEGSYSDDGDRETIADYDKVVEAYYAKRRGGSKAMTWTRQVAGLLSEKCRPHMLPFLHSKGFLKR